VKASKSCRLEKNWPASGLEALPAKVWCKQFFCRLLSRDCSWDPARETFWCFGPLRFRGKTPCGLYCAGAQELGAHRVARVLCTTCSLLGAGPCWLGQSAKTPDAQGLALLKRLAGWSAGIRLSGPSTTNPGE